MTELINITEKRGRGRPKKNNLDLSKSDNEKKICKNDEKINEEKRKNIDNDNIIIINNLEFIKITSKQIKDEDKPKKRGRGRPKKNINDENKDKENNDITEKKDLKEIKRGRGRPKKIERYVFYNEKSYIIDKNNIVKDYFLGDEVGIWNNNEDTIDYYSDYFTDND